MTAVTRQPSALRIATVAMGLDDAIVVHLERSRGRPVVSVRHMTRFPDGAVRASALTPTTSAVTVEVGALGGVADALLTALAVATADAGSPA